MMLASRNERAFSTVKAVAAAAAVAVILVVAAVIYYATAGGGEAVASTAGPATKWYTVEPISFDLTIVAQGELEALNQVELKCQVTGRPTIIEVVDEGTFVQEGDVLVRLDPTDITQKLEQAQLDVEKAQASVVAAEQTLAIELDEAESNRKKAEVALNLAQLDLEKWQKGEDVQKRNELELALQKANRRLERAKRDHELSKELYAQEFISLNDLEDSEIEEIEAEDALATAKLNIEVYENYEFLKEKQKYESDVEQARAELERTISKNKNKLEQLRSDLLSKQRQLRIHEARVAELEEQLGYCTITAPQNGMVVYATSVGRRRWRNDPIAVGRQVQSNESIILLPDTSEMVAVLKVHEALINSVAPGQETTVVIDAMRDQPMRGEVITKSVTPDDGGWLNPNLREYKVRVALPTGTNGDLKPAMRCNGQIVTGRVTDSLAVPVQAVFAEGEQKYCYVAGRGGQIQRTAVQLGQASDTLVQVVAGLEEGDRVLLSRPGPGEAVDEQAPQDEAGVAPADAA